MRRGGRTLKNGTSGSKPQGQKRLDEFFRSPSTSSNEEYTAQNRSKVSGDMQIVKVCQGRSKCTFGIQETPIVTGDAVLKQKLCDIKNGSCSGLNDALEELLKTNTLERSWLELNQKVLNEVKSSLNRLKQEQQLLKSDLVDYIAVLYGTIVNKDGSDLYSPLVPQVVDEMLRLLSLGLSYSGFIPQKDIVRVVFLFLYRVDLKDNRSICESIWSFLYRLLCKYPPHDEYSRAYWIYVLVAETLDEDSYRIEGKLIKSFRDCISAIFSDKERYNERWFWLSVLERDMCVCLLEDNPSDIPSLSDTGLAFFIFFDPKHRSRYERLLSDRSVDTICEWLHSAMEWGNVNYTVLENLKTCIRFISLLFESVRFMEAPKVGALASGKNIVSEGLKNSLRQIAKKVFLRDERFDRISCLFATSWMQAVVGEVMSG